MQEAERAVTPSPCSAPRFLASDDEGAKATVRELVESGGLRAFDVGALARAHELEALGYLHTAVQQSLGTGFASGVKVVGIP